MKEKDEKEVAALLSRLNGDEDTGEEDAAAVGDAALCPCEVMGSAAFGGTSATRVAGSEGVAATGALSDLAESATGTLSGFVSCGCTEAGSSCVDC